MTLTREMHTFYSTDPSNPFRTVCPPEADIVMVKVYRCSPRMSGKIVLAKVFRCDVADDSMIVEKFDGNLHCHAPLTFNDGAFEGKIRENIRSIAQDQATILIDTGTCKPAIIRAFQAKEERTILRNIAGEMG